MPGPSARTCKRQLRENESGHPLRTGGRLLSCSGRPLNVDAGGDDGCYVLLVKLCYSGCPLGSSGRPLCSMVAAVARFVVWLCLCLYVVTAVTRFFDGSGRPLCRVSAL